MFYGGPKGAICQIALAGLSRLTPGSPPRLSPPQTPQDVLVSVSTCECVAPHERHFVCVKYGAVTPFW